MLDYARQWREGSTVWVEVTRDQWDRLDPADRGIIYVDLDGGKGSVPVYARKVEENER